MNNKLFILLFLLIPQSLFAADLYVSASGSGTACTIGEPCSLYYANTHAVAGDNVYLRAGTYYIGDTSATGNGNASGTPSPGIVPTNSGTYAAGACTYITYEAYRDEVVNFAGLADNGTTYSIGAWLTGTCVKINGKACTAGASPSCQINMSKMSANIVVGLKTGTSPTASNMASYNDIGYVYATNSSATASWRFTWQSVAIWKNAQYNRLHHCIIEKHGYQLNTSSGQEGDIIWIGNEADYAESPTNKDRFNIIENNEFRYGAHATFGVNSSKYNIIRNNYIHNNPWFEYSEGNYAGYRNIMASGHSHNSGWNIFEKNRIGHASSNWYAITSGAMNGGVGAKWGHANNILRHNSFFGNTSDALVMYNGYVHNQAHYNHVYNNTFYYNGTSTHNEPVSLYWVNTSAFWSDIYKNVYKNNLFYNNDNRDPSFDYGGSTAANCTGCGAQQGCNEISNNFNGTSGNVDPLFTDTTMDQYNDSTLPNFSLQSSSSAIDSGTYLTTTTNSGEASTTLTVANAHYFQDGKFLLKSASFALPDYITFEADEIAIGTIANTVKISDIYRVLKLGVAPGGAGWAEGNTITGDESGTQCTVVSVTNTTEYIVKDCTGDYKVGESLSNGTDAADQAAYILYNLNVRPTPTAGSWQVGDTITGVTSGVTSIIVSIRNADGATADGYVIRNLSGSYQATESLTNGTYATGTENTGYPNISARGLYPILEYSNTIILAEAKTWSASDPVWLYKNSSGTVVLYGESSDMGAHEYNSDETGDPPSYNVTVSKTGDGCTLTHDGVYAVETGNTLNVGLVVNNGWKGTWSGTCSATGEATTGSTRVCTPAAEQCGSGCTVAFTCSEIYIFK